MNLRYKRQVSRSFFLVSFHDSSHWNSRKIMSTTKTILTLCLALCITIGHGRVPKKVLGGEMASHEFFLFQASLRVNGKHTCSGTIIDDTHVLTVASCVLFKKNVVQVNIQVWTGAKDLEDPNAQKYDVDVIIVHRDFDFQNSWKDNIAILKLATPIVAIPMRQQPALLPAGLDVTVDSVASVTGWGSEDPDQYHRYLQKLDLTVISNEECQTEHFLPIFPGQICGESRSGFTFGNGDAGSPLTWHNTFVVGLASWTSIGNPGVFTRVFHYIPWINEKTRVY